MDRVASEESPNGWPPVSSRWKKADMKRSERTSTILGTLLSTKGFVLTESVHHIIFECRARLHQEGPALRSGGSGWDNQASYSRRMPRR